MRSVAEIMGSAPAKQQAAAPRSDQPPTGSDPGGGNRTESGSAAAAMRSAGADAADSGRREAHANGGSAGIGTAAAEPDSERWTDAQVRFVQLRHN